MDKLTVLIFLFSLNTAAYIIYWRAPVSSRVVDSIKLCLLSLCCPTIDIVVCKHFNATLDKKGVLLDLMMKQQLTKTAKSCSTTMMYLSGSAKLLKMKNRKFKNA